MKFEMKHKNYCAVVVQVETLVQLAGCDNVQAALVFGNQVIVSKDMKVGDVVIYFPLETALGEKFLGANNLYRHAEWGNADPAKKGFFEEHGRVKAVKFRGHKSEGFVIGLDSLAPLGFDPTAFNVGDEFDTIDGQEICHKYVVKSKKTPGEPGSKKGGGRKARIEDQIVPGQLRLHYDTGQLRRNCHKIQPEDLISISDKWHGTSVVIGNLLTEKRLHTRLKALAIRLGDGLQGLSEKGLLGRARRGGKDYYPKLSLAGKAAYGLGHALDSVGSWASKDRPSVSERLLPLLGVRVQTHERTYGLVATSRNVVKYVAGAPKPGAQHYYEVEPGQLDVYSQVGLSVQNQIPKGFTVYGEIVGYLPGGKPVQSMKGKAFHYGCPDGEHQLRVYRVTFTNEDGKVFELHWKHMLQFCQKHGLTPVVEEFYGTALDFVLSRHPNAVTKTVDGVEIRGPWSEIPSAKLPEKAGRTPSSPSRRRTTARRR